MPNGRPSATSVSIGPKIEKLRLRLRGRVGSNLEFDEAGDLGNVNDGNIGRALKFFEKLWLILTCPK